MFNYLWPMSSLGVNALFYYHNKNNNVILMMQRRSLKMSHAPGQIATTGGYANAGVTDCGEYECLVESLRREIREEIGAEFEATIPQNAIRMDNIAQIRQKFEDRAPIPLKGYQKLLTRAVQIFTRKPKALQKQMNINFIWVIKVTQEDAQKAIVADPNEVGEIVHIPLSNIDKVQNIRPWIPDAVKEFNRLGLFS
ncbi:MAG: hypothetical protein VX154_00630 [Pseudomonadota bacterium]|nr:hypothetical protein [Pseudomonadota bacterium]